MLLELVLESVVCRRCCRRETTKHDVFLLCYDATTPNDADEDDETHTYIYVHILDAFEILDYATATVCAPCSCMDYNKS